MWQQSDAEQPEQTEETRPVGAPVPADYQPTRLIYCTWGRERGAPPLPLASFDWAPDTGVQFTVLDYERGRSAKRFITQGANFEQERRMVMPEEGPVFMRALLGHGNSSSYFWFVDRTPATEPDA